MKTRISTLLFLLLISYTCYSQNNESAEKLFENAKKLINTDTKKASKILLEARRNSNPKNKLLNEKIELNFAIIERFNGNYQKSIQKTSKILKNTNYADIKASAYNNLGACYKNIGEKKKALNYYITSCNIYRKENNFSELAVVENNIGLLFQSIEDYDKAKNYHKKALNYFVSIDDDINIAKSYNMIGITLANQDSLQNALLNFKKSYSLNKRHNNIIGISEDVNNIGGIFYLMKKYDSAITYYKKSLEIDRQNRDFSNLADGLNNIANIYIDKKDFKNAKIKLDSALYYSKKYKYMSAYLHNLEDYSILYELNKNPQLSLRYLKKYHSIKDSLDIENNLKDINELEKKYETEKKQNLINQQQFEIKQKNIWLIFGGILFLTSMISAFFIYRNYQHKQDKKLQKEIFRQQELEAKALFEGEQNERIRIARDLHDSVGQMLSLVKMNLSSQEQTSENENTQSLVDKTISEVRNISHNLIPEELNFGIFPALENLADNVNSTSKTKIELQIPEEIRLIKFQKQNELSIYRIVQEVVNNMIKHADASSINLSIKKLENSLIINIKDNGKGLDDNSISNSSGIGWKNINARVHMMDGKIKIESEKLAGTQIEITLPQNG